MLRNMKINGQRHTSSGDQKSEYQRGITILPTLTDLGINKTQSSRWQKLAVLSDEVANQAVAIAIERANETITPTVKVVIKSHRQKSRSQSRQALADAAALPDDDRWQVFHGSIETWDAPRQYDFIITDPPYPKDYLYCYETLALRSCDWLDLANDNRFLLNASENQFSTGQLNLKQM
ncbi:MAG: hypothetical protein PHY16_18295 [Methylobacter sp.]|nr:hypothetical protein [Methylobacter sp.]